MALKKKFLHGFLGLFGVLLSFILLHTCSIVYATEPLYNQSRQDTFFGKYTMQNIVDELELDEVYSGDALEGLTYWANQFMTSYNNSSGDLVLQDLVIQKGSNNALYIYVANNTADGGQNRDYIYIETVSVYAQMKYVYLDHWVYSGQNISYPLTKGMVGNIFLIDSSHWQAGSSQRYYVDSYTDSLIYLSDSVTFIPYSVAGYTQSYGYNWYFLNHTVNVEVAPTPTPVPSVTPRPSGDYSQQLDNIEYTLLETKDELHNTRVDINQGFDDLQSQMSGDTQKIIDSITTVPSGDDFDSLTSGDILSSLDFEETQDPYENFWANFTSGLSSALTCDNNTTFDIELFGETITIYPDDWIIDYPLPIRTILTISSTIGIVFAELKMWRRLIILINTGNLMSIAQGYSKNDITDLF